VLLTLGLIVVGVVIVGFLIDRLALWMESRGWIYWRRSERRGSASLGLLETIYQPSMTHVFEEETREQTEADQDESGEDR
jgi:hypothetical protein